MIFNDRYFVKILIIFFTHYLKIITCNASAHSNKMKTARLEILKTKEDELKKISADATKVLRKFADTERCIQAIPS